MTGSLALPAVLTGTPVSGPDARRAAIQELSRPEYHRDDPSWPNRALTWLLQRLDGLGGASVHTSALAVLGVILLAGGVLTLIRAGRPTRTAIAATTGPDPLQPGAGRDHARAAQDLTDAGRYTEALREWLRASVSTLERRGVLDPRPGRTADDIARTAGARLPDAAQALRTATDAFDAVWFGGRTGNAADAEAGRQAADAVGRAPMRSAQIEPNRYAVPR